MSFSRLNFIINSLRKLKTNLNKNRLPLFLNRFNLNKCNQSVNFKYSKTFLFASASIFSWNPFKKTDDENNPENQLITNIKLSILSIQNGEYHKAEKLLHVALRMAQDLNHRDGITYIYDIMANLALESKDFVKSEKLFIDIMKRLLSEGMQQDDNKILHISSKIAHIAHLQENFEKASQGFLWTLEKIDEKLKRVKDDENLLELFGLTKNWYAQLLMDNNKYEEAKKYLNEAYEIYTKFHGQINQDAILMLNNLGVLCTKLNDFDSAEDYLRRAMDFAKEVPNLVEIGIIQANLGIVYIKKGLIKQARDICSIAWRFGTKYENANIVEQANYCLEQIKTI